MLNFAEQTGSGAVIVVWSFLFISRTYPIYEHVTLLLSHSFILHYTSIFIYIWFFFKCHMVPFCHYFFHIIINFIIFFMLNMTKYYQKSLICSKIQPKLCFLVQITHFSYNSNVIITCHFQMCFIILYFTLKCSKWSVFELIFSNISIYWINEVLL